MLLDMTPTYTADLFPPLHAQLITLLRALDDGDWERPTVAGRWRVRDVAAHLLDGDLRKLSGGRDEHQMSNRVVASFKDLVGLINDLNADGVGYAARLSPRVMVDLLETTGRWVSEYMGGLPPHASARWSVAWAGEDRSENWMDVGREYTERWHHQMHIRDAVGAEALFQRQWFHPMLDLSVRAFPRAYEHVAATDGAVAVFEVDADGENAWSVTRGGSEWTVSRGRPSAPAASLRTDADTAWKLLYNALPAQAARARVTITGDAALVEPMFGARSVMV